MKRFKSKKKINYIFIIIIIIVILSTIIYINITSNISNKMLTIIKEQINYSNNNILMNYIELSNLEDDKLDDIINYVKNSDDEIIAIDYNMKKSYSILKDISKKIKKGINDNLMNNTSYIKETTNDGIIVYYPIGIASNNIYLNNLGPTIPVKINYLNSVVVGLKTKVSNYGINNVLVEMYLKVTMDDSIIIPLIKDKVTNTYELLLDAKVIMGSVPTLLGTTIENNSPLVSSE